MLWVKYMVVGISDKLDRSNSKSEASTVILGLGDKEK